MSNKWYQAVSGRLNCKIKIGIENVKHKNNPLGNFRGIYTILKYIFYTVTNVLDIKFFSI